MEHFSGILLLTLFHSFWQSAIIAMVIYLFKRSRINIHPSTVRRLSVYGLFAQFAFSLCSFGLLFFQTGVELPGKIVGLHFTFAFSLSQYLTLAYLLIVVLLFIKTFWGWKIFRKTVKAGHEIAPSHFWVFTKNTALQLGIKRRVHLFLSSGVSVPVTFGIFKPVILLPVALLNHLSIAETESIIIHELQHIRVKDYLVNWVCIIAKNLFFFNPAVLYIIKEIRQSREKSCDAGVLDFQYPVITYASALLKTANLNLNSSNFALSASGNHSNELKARVVFMRDRYQASEKKDIWPVFLTLLLIMGGVLLIAISKPAPSITGAFSISNKEKYKAGGVAYNLEIAETINPEAIPVTVAKRKDVKPQKPPAPQQHIEKPAKLNLENTPILTLIPVADRSISAPKEVTIREEDSELGVIITSHYLLEQNQEGYQMRLLWKIAETPLPDSVRRLHGDSTVIYLPNLNNIQ